ncbi:Pentatricopeptide repeat [Dillenia turbinata]|uniref:Pentatricopeptide repeat n=1 Tax=Dillenia turbinata TaxID=194707 RepID=A0AAN8VV63_9MAGN
MMMLWAIGNVELKPVFVTYRTYIHRMCKAGKFKEAKEIFCDAFDLGTTLCRQRKDKSMILANDETII